MSGGHIPFSVRIPKIGNAERNNQRARGAAIGGALPQKTAYLSLFSQ